LLFGCSAGTGVGEASGGNRPGILAASREESETSPGDCGKDSRPGTRHQSGSNMVANVDTSLVMVGISNQATNERGDTSGGVSEEAESEVEDIDSQERTLSHIASGFHFNSSDFLFGDVETDPLRDFDVLNSSTFGLNGVDPAALDGNQSANAWPLPNEAFQPRHEIKDRSVPPEHFTSRRFAETRIETQTVEVEDQTSALLCLPGTHVMSSWNGVSNVVELLYHLADEGDVQTVVTMILVLGERIIPLLNENAIEHWFFSYLNSLSQFRLWNTAALVSKMSPCGSIQRLSHRSTVYCTNCNLCRRSLQRSGWLCDACKSITNTCSLCHLVVRGLYVWCRGCSHGGHLVHIMEWFKKNEACPTGCGHICEYD